VNSQGFLSLKTQTNTAQLTVLKNGGTKTAFTFTSIFAVLFGVGADVRLLGDGMDTTDGKQRTHNYDWKSVHHSISVGLVTLPSNTAPYRQARQAVIPSWHNALVRGRRKNEGRSTAYTWEATAM
jgi:hypothetical protein